MDKEFESKSIELEKFKNILQESDSEHKVYNKSIEMLDKVIKNNYYGDLGELKPIKNKLIKKEQKKDDE